MRKPTAKSAKRQPMDALTPTTKANLLAQLAESVLGLFAELKAWQEFGRDVADYLDSKGLQSEFEAFRAGRKPPTG